jgi:hypothetical protein
MEKHTVQPQEKNSTAKLKYVLVINANGGFTNLGDLRLSLDAGVYLCICCTQCL